MQHAVIITECAEALPLDAIKQGFNERVQWASVVLQPEMFGCPVGRRRRFCVAWDSSQVVMSQRLDEVALLRMFGRRLVMPACRLFAAPLELIEMDIKQKARKCRVDLSNDEVKVLAMNGRLPSPVGGVETYLDLLALISPAETQQLRNYNLAGSGKHSSATVVDKSQGPNRLRSGQDICPTLCCKTKLHLPELGREALPCEYLVAQGVKGYRLVDNSRFEPPWLDLVHNGALSGNQVRLLCGNGQNVTVVAALQLFLLAYTCPVLAE